jgi:hypothetical protein
MAGGLVVQDIAMVDSVGKNNPMNIRIGQPWQGLADEEDDTGFCTFKSPEYGIRAGMLIIRSYAKRGINTVQGIISTWAPPSENDTDSYVAQVAAQLGVKPTDSLVNPDRGTLKGGANPVPKVYSEDKNTMFCLVKAIIKREIGKQPYPDAVFNSAWELAA